MDSISMTVKKESITSFQSTISKFEKAMAQMTEKGVNTKLLQKRLQAHYVGLAVLENAWHQNPQPFSDGELAEAHIVLADLFPSLENAYHKSKAGSPQRTLLARRIRALELAVFLMEKSSAD
ncbi:hypothetical protein [Planococcus koreensis]|uniref:hypothetical protein n=1 Tax=Planococcus koreensis TaxID=112331 RepID=UPI0039FBF4C8